MYLCSQHFSNEDYRLPVADGWAPFDEEEVLRNLQPQANIDAQVQALSYLDNLKSTNHFWRLAARLLLGDKNLYDNVVFFLWQALEEHVHCQSPCDEEDRRIMREFISLWIIQQGSNSNSLQSCIRNKAAQVISLVFLRDYLTVWPSFFSDLMKPWSCGVHGVDNFLRVLKNICIEVADQDLVRTMEEFERNTEIKNRMRESAIPQLVDLWHEILKTKELSPAMHCQCLEVIGLYISWIDIGLIATDRFMPLFVTLCKSTQTRESVVECLDSMVDKGMTPTLKLDLICGIGTVFHAENLFEPIENDPTDFCLKVAELMNTIGINLMETYTTSPAIDMHRLCNEIDREVPYILAFLNNEDDDVSAAVLESAKAYVRLLRSKLPMLTEDEQNNVHILLHTVVKKMKYDESYSFDRNGEDEADFLCFRIHLKGLLDNLASLNLDLLMEFTFKIVQEALQNWMNLPFEDVEVAITLLYYVGELSNVNNFRNNTTKVSRIQEMMRTLVTCGVSAHSMPVIVLQYLETVVRYEKFFLVEPEHIPSLLMTFLDNRGMRHEDCKVRSRCAFLFTKFIKALRGHIQPYTKDLLIPLQGLLMPLNGPNSQQLITYDDQLYLYEACAILIAASPTSVPEKAVTFHELLQPICDRFSLLLSRLQAESNKEVQSCLIIFMGHLMAVASRASKAFPNLTSMEQCSCQGIFLQCLRTFLPCLKVNCDITLLQLGMRQFLHRMVVCLEEQVIPYIPEASQGLLRDCTAQKVLEYLPLIIQVIAKFKKAVSHYMMQMFMPIIRAVFSALAIPVDVNDEETRRERQLLRRNYFAFISVIVGEMIDVLKCQEVDVVQNITLTVVEAAVDFPDPVSQKTCFTIMRKLVIFWGGKNAPEEFLRFVIRHIVPACFMAPLQPTFDLSDSQTCIALTEIAACMQTIYDKQGEEYMVYLREHYLPTLQLNPEQIENYCNALTKDKKQFKAFIRLFFEQIHS